MASVQHIHILDRDIRLQSWGQMNENVINSGLWNIWRKDLGRLRKIFEKKQQAHAWCSLCNSEVWTQSERVDRCWGFLTALLRLPELSEGLISLCEAFTTHCPHWIFKESTSRISMGPGKCSFTCCISYKPRNYFFFSASVILISSIGHVLMVNRAQSLCLIRYPLQVLHGLSMPDAWTP